MVKITNKRKSKTLINTQLYKIMKNKIEQKYLQNIGLAKLN